MRAYIRASAAIFVLAASVCWADQTPQMQGDIQVELCPAQLSDLLNAIGLEEDDGKNRDIYLFDTPSLDLLAQGSEVRLRSSKKEIELTFKRRALTYQDVGPSWWNHSDFKCEVDVHGAASLPSCSLNQSVDSDILESLTRRSSSVDSAFSADSLAFIQQFSNSEPLLAKTVALGPIRSRYWKFQVDGFSEKMSLEYRPVSDRLTVYELSVKASGADNVGDQKKFLAQVQSWGLPVCADQAGQMRAVLQELLKGNI